MEEVIKEVEKMYNDLYANFLQRFNIFLFNKIKSTII